MNDTEQLRTATCKTCGSKLPHHKPSMLDPDGIGHVEHKILTNPTHPVPISVDGEDNMERIVALETNMPIVKEARSEEYQKGYDSGYHAGQRSGAAHLQAAKKVAYKKGFSDGQDSLLHSGQSVLDLYTEDQLQAAIQAAEGTLLNKLLELHHMSEAGSAKHNTSQDGYEYGLEDAIALLVPDVHEALYRYNKQHLEKEASK